MSTDIYPPTFYAALADKIRTSPAAIVPIIMSILDLKSVADVGCGTGLWLRAFQEAGVTRIAGFDGIWVDRTSLVIPQEYFTVIDLSSGSWNVDDRFDLAICLEVAEHLPWSSSTRFVKTLTELSPAVLFSAALPGQGGTNHINEQWPIFWEREFARFGYIRLDPIRRKVWFDARVAWYYQQNIYLFVHRELVTTNPILRQEEGLIASSPQLTLVHERILSQWSCLSGVMFHELPRLLLQAIRRRLWRLN